MVCGGVAARVDTPCIVKDGPGGMISTHGSFWKYGAMGDTWDGLKMTCGSDECHDAYRKAYPYDKLWDYWCKRGSITMWGGAFPE